MKTLLKLLAPYLAVAVFWCVFANAWLAILAYHAQILFWSWSERRRLHRPPRARALFWALPAVLAGPVLYLLLPAITRTEPGPWLAAHHLSGTSLLAMIPYFGLVHPILEQLHWAGLREKTPWAHVLFAGYHVLVLYALLTLPWLLACFAVLVAASVGWRLLSRMTGSLAVAAISHVLADLGVVLAAWAAAR